MAEPQRDPKTCEKGFTISKDDTLFAYVKSNTLYPLAFWSGSKLKSTNGFFPKHHSEFVDVEGKNAMTIPLEPAHFDDHTGDCIFSRSIKNANKTTPYIVASKKTSFKVPIPVTAKEKFRRLKDKCVNHGDDVPQKCLYPELIAVSDLDNNGREEFWYERPYMWDKGVSVGEVSANGKTLTNIAEDCSDCSD